MSSHNKDWLALATLDDNLAAMSVYAHSDTGDPSRTALHPAKQHDAAQKCVEVASALLLKLGSASV